MKNILLTTTALVAFAGAAAADGHTSVSHALSATLGYNNEVDAIGEDGFFWEGNLKTTATAALDNGLTAGAYFEITVSGDDAAAGSSDAGNALVASDFVLSLTSETASLYFGDTAPAGKKYFSAAGDMESDGFSTDSDSAVLRGDVSFGGMNGSVSYIVDDKSNTAEQMAVGLGGSFGSVTVGFGYQEATTYVDAEGDFNNSAVMGVSASTTVAGATVTVAYADDSNDGVGQTGIAQTSTAIQVAYPMGPVTATAYYSMEQVNGVDAVAGDNMGLTLAYAQDAVAVTLKVRDEQGRNEWNLEGSYDMGNGATILAGALNENEGADADFYIGGTYDLGGGASILAVYADDKDGDQKDEIGSGEYDPGMTVAVSFTF
jgi:outer membrane protein OmpU